MTEIEIGDKEAAIFKQLKAALEEMGWKYEETEGLKNSVRVVLKGESFKYSLRYFVGATIVWLLVDLPFVFSGDKRPALLELINTANDKVPFGAAYVRSSGEVEFRNSLWHEGDLTAGAVMRLSASSIISIDEIAKILRALE